jgi:putative SOS response-associated peptidase YedK
MQGNRTGFIGVMTTYSCLLGYMRMKKPTDNGVPINFTILTCAANPTLATIHDRMPVILSDRDADDWMNPREQAPLSLIALLIPAPEPLLVVQSASPLVNSVKNEGPELLASSGTKGQMSFNF